MPDALARVGLPLEDWQASFDIADGYWNRQRVVRRMEPGLLLKLFAAFALLVVLSIPMRIILVDRKMNRKPCKPKVHLRFMFCITVVGSES